ncbi:MAG: class I SAM-dependent methyltransferase [Calditrichaeota bacterium]|nr:class I SAM-dependent methyltransferase [Calditrichota bacterium]
MVPEEIDRLLRQWEDPEMLTHEQARGLYAVLISEMPERSGLTFLEFGTYCAASTSVLALVAREKGGRVISVDTFDSRGTGHTGDTWATAERNLRERGLLDIVTLVRGQTQFFNPEPLGLESIDVFFHDASHDVYDILFDFGNIARWLADDALVLIHDVAKGGGPTKPALLYLCKLFGVRGRIFLDANLGGFRLQGNPLRS